MFVVHHVSFITELACVLCLEILTTRFLDKVLFRPCENKAGNCAVNSSGRVGVMCYASCSVVKVRRTTLPRLDFSNTGVQENC